MQFTSFICLALTITAAIDSGSLSGVILFGGFKLSVTLKPFALWCISLHTHSALWGLERHAKISDWYVKGKHNQEIPRGFYQAFNYVKHKYPKAFYISNDGISVNFHVCRPSSWQWQPSYGHNFHRFSTTVCYSQLIAHCRISLIWLKFKSTMYN